MLRSRIWLTLAVGALAAQTMACAVQLEQTLEMQPGSVIFNQLIGQNGQPLPPDAMVLEGGTVMNISIDVTVLDWLDGTVDGDITVPELLFGAPSFNFLGIKSFPTGTICVVLEQEDPGGGAFSYDVFNEQASFDVAINTIALIGNAGLAQLLPGGGMRFPFAFTDTQDMTLFDAIGLATGTGELEVTQEINMPLQILLDGDGPGGNPPFVLNAKVFGFVTLKSVDAFPSTPLVEECIARLAL